MEFSIIGALSGHAQITHEMLESLLVMPALDMAHGGEFTGKPTTEIHADEGWLLKIDARRAFDSHDIAEKWCKLQIEKERQYGIYHPDRCWFVVRRESWVVGNVSPRMQPLHIIDFTTLSVQRRLQLLSTLLEIYCRFATQSEKRLDEGLSNFALIDDQLWYIDDDIYPWDSFASFSAMLANWLRQSDTLGLDAQLWQQLGATLKPLLRSYSSSADDMVYEGISDQFVGLHEEYKNVFISELRSARSIHMERSAIGRFESNDKPIGLIADVHANLPAFEAVLAAFDERGIDQIMHLGDIVGYGPHPHACIELSRERGIFCVRGNHDHYVAHNGDVKVAASSSAKWTLDWTVNQLGDEEKAWLGMLPVRHRMKGWMAVHGSPIDKSFFNGYVYNMTAEKNLEYLRARDTKLCLHGHSHIQGMYAMQGRVVQPFSTTKQVDLKQFSAALVCPGSVGQPRGGQIGAEAAIFYPDSCRIDFFSADYDVERVASDMQANDFPERIVQRLREGH